MNREAVRWARAIDATPQEKALLMQMAAYADSDGKLYPHVATLAGDTGLSERTTYRLIASTERKGLLIRLSKHRKHGNVYVLPISTEAADKAEKIRRCGTAGWQVKPATGGRSNLPLVAGLPIENEEPEKNKRTPPNPPERWGEAQAPVCSHDEDEARAALGDEERQSRRMAFEEEAANSADRRAKITVTHGDRDPSPSSIAKRQQSNRVESSMNEPRPELSREGLSTDDLERWQQFEAEWGFQAGRESREAARRAFLALNARDQGLCAQGAAALQIPAGRRVLAVTFIRERHWAFPSKGAPKPRASSPSPQPPQSCSSAGVTRLPDGRFFLPPGSANLAAWENFERRTVGRAKGGCARPAEWPPCDS